MATREPGPMAMTAAMIVCCGLTLLIIAGGLGAASGVLGGAIRNPYLIAAGVALVAVVVTVYLAGRRHRRNRKPR